MGEAERTASVEQVRYAIQDAVITALESGLLDPEDIRDEVENTLTNANFGVHFGDR